LKHLGRGAFLPRKLFILLLLAAACSGKLCASPAWSDVLRVAFRGADPAFERDEMVCGAGKGVGYAGYLGAERVCADALVDRLLGDERLLRGGVEEIVLLTSRPNERTIYRVGSDRHAILALAHLSRGDDAVLRIRGQRTADGAHLVWFKGLALVETICDPERVLDVADCRAGRSSGREDASLEPWERRYEMTSLASVEEAALAAPGGPFDPLARSDKGVRSYCVRLRNVAGVVLADLAFEDCWLTAVSVINSRNVTLRSARIHGSTFGMLAVATSGMEPTVHTFQVLDTHWIQSPGAYRPSASPCPEPHLDLGCAADSWYDLPWGVAHHHLWRPLNGALFGAYNIAGNVLFAGNLVERAFNGLRMISEREDTGRNVEIRGNHFRLIRDNAVEPEVRADGWIVKHNRFENVHGWISSDGVAGGSLYAFGNIGWSDTAHVPGERCRDDVEWWNSPHLFGLAGASGRYLLLDTSDDPTSVECRGHLRGMVLKTGDNLKRGFPYLRGISIFNNSWRTRSPLFAGGHASPLSHFNNAISFTGCGLDGPWHCRQIPEPLQDCGPGNKSTRGRVGLPQTWTKDGSALVADCFSFTPGPAEPDERARATRHAAHVFCRDAFDRPFETSFYGSEDCEPVLRAQLFREDLRLAEPLRGCRVRVERDVVVPDCGLEGPEMGAIQGGGALFDVDIPGAGFLAERFAP